MGVRRRRRGCILREAQPTAYTLSGLEWWRIIFFFFAIRAVLALIRASLIFLYSLIFLSNADLCYSGLCWNASCFL